MLEKRLITIDKGKDAGKVFEVSQMPVSRLEKWSARALIVLFAGDIPLELKDISAVSNSAALAAGVLSGLGALDWEKVEPLYDELLSCISVVPDPARPNVVVPLNASNLDAHIAEIGTIIKLRGEVLAVNLDFFGGENGLFSRMKQAVARVTSETTDSPPV